jgi:hypothetical protein
MSKARLTVAQASFAAVAAGLLTAAGLATPAAGSTSSSTCISSGKCYLASVSPGSVPAGDSTEYLVTVANKATTQTLGSVQLTAPSGFTVTGASGGTASHTSTSALFLNLSLSPGTSATLRVDATAPCGSVTSAWGIQAKQSNQFNGSGNDFQLDPASSLSATVTGTCRLAFSGGGQPASTAAGQPISSGFDSSGSPVAVEVLDGSGQLLTSSTAAVTLAIGSNPGSGTLSGTTMVNASGGVASFPGISINATGSGYTLVATSPAITSATSRYFDIWGTLQSCPGASCTGSSASKTTTGTVSTSSASGQFLGVGLGGVSFACGGSYQPLSDPLSFDVLSSAGVADPSAQFDATLEIDKSVVQSSGHPGASTWQICYADTVPFTTRLGTEGTATVGPVTYYTGELPDCSSSQPAPCVVSRNKDNAGDVVVEFLASGDLFARM